METVAVIGQWRLLGRPFADILYSPQPRISYERATCRPPTQLQTALHKGSVLSLTFGTTLRPLKRTSPSIILQLLVRPEREREQLETV